MSGGSLNYVYSTIENELYGMMQDAELNVLVRDFVKLAHDLEWALSGDTSMDSYFETVRKFKQKWLKKYRKEKNRQLNAKYTEDYLKIKALEEEEVSAENWIPVSERKPEPNTDVLVWFEYFRYGSYNCLYQTYGIGTYSSYDMWMINHETGWQDLKVLAWMPMPEPYKS